jgi:hypothetical protein
MNLNSNTKKIFTLYGLMLTVWFDAWKYKNEKEFALIPLLKTINYSINDDKNEKKKRPKIKLIRHMKKKKENM